VRIASIAAQQTSVPRPMVNVIPWPLNAGSFVSSTT
jgi:hypothetical protein